jgi:hypothetical protein
MAADRALRNLRHSAATERTLIADERIRFLVLVGIKILGAGAHPVREER